jgi:hypothetical protein
MQERKLRSDISLIACIFFVSSFGSVIQAQSVLAAPVFDHNHGFYETPFSLTITSSNMDVRIFYTTNGRIPGADNGTLYTGPINISTTATIRAVCIKDNIPPSKITTQSFLFPDDIIHQTNNPDGYPVKWGPYTAISGTATADYEMDPEMMADTDFANSVKEALLDLPTISLVTNKGYFFSNSQDPDTGGIYIYTGPPLDNSTNGLGSGWERPVSFEYFDARDTVSFQVDCGIRIQGGHGRRPEKSPKHSLRLVFRSEYGPEKLNYSLFGKNSISTFNTIILRAGFGNTWIHWNHSERSMAQYLRDRWTKDTHSAMGHNSSQGSYVHLYINGLYWGIYNPSERLDREYASTHLGGDEMDYDVIKDYTEVVDGNITAWNKMMLLANAGLSGNEAYQNIQGNYPDGTPDPNIEAMVDVVSLADYMLLNFYGGNWDWDHHNWVAMRNRVNPGKGFQFFCWDAEHMVESVNANELAENNANCPSRLFQQLRKNEEFRRLFADRVQKFCFNNGALTPSSAAQRWIIRSNQIDKAVIAESARWGDYRRDVHQWQAAGPFELYTKETHWLPQMNYMLNTYFPNRTIAFLNQLRSADLFPETAAPVFLINNKPVSQKTIISGDALSMSSGEGSIYYTTNGSDPVIWYPSPSVSPYAKIYTVPLILNESSHLKARTYSNGDWSATSEQFFIVEENFHDIKITEIHYHPLDQGIIENKEFEFIELKNTGNSTLDLSGLQFTEGIEFRFPEETALRLKEFIVLASNRKCFYDRYGFLPFGTFEGQLDNNGERIVLIGAEKDTICSFLYSAFNGWPEAPDGEGNSLVPTEFNPANDQDRPEFWRASYNIGGSPGADDNPQIGISSEIFTVYQNYPNPFSEFTNLSYQLHEEAHIQLIIYDITGRPVVTLEDKNKPAGFYNIEWKGLNGNNNIVDNGIYFLRIVAKNQNGTNSLTRKMLLIR